MTKYLAKCALAVMAVGMFAPASAKEYLCLYKNGEVVDMRPVEDVDSIGFKIIDVLPDIVFKDAFDEPYILEARDKFNGVSSSYDVKWSSSDMNVAAVTTSGVVVPVLSGVCDITAEYEGETATWRVEVVAGWKGDITVSGGDGRYNYVDLGLPSGRLWATCNVGAMEATEYGDYFAWGETVTKKEYTRDNSLMHNQSIPDGATDADTYFTEEYDAASANWGPKWKMPVDADFKELVEYCKSALTVYNNVLGRVFVGPNGNTMFMPIAGVRTDEFVMNGTYSVYWSANPVMPFGLKMMSNALFIVGSSGKAVYSNEMRYTGASVRPVFIE